LRTAKGAAIIIAKGSLQAKGNTVQLEVKEAYTISDMIKGGLTTKSGTNILSSAGMIYINAVEPDVKIVKPLKVATPSDLYRDNMQLYQGVLNKDSTINWIKPCTVGETR